MKTLVFWLTTLVVFGVVNGMIAKKEATIRNGVTIYLPLETRDPRSLMQGDYMSLRYDLNGVAPNQRRGQFVVQLSPTRVAKVVRVDDGGPLKQGEYRLRFSKGAQGIRIATDSFFFQEGHAKDYANAKYGELKVALRGGSALVGLRNADLTDADPATKAGSKVEEAD
ncbi:MAG: GDYXXLXY domain-containing protein [Pirellulaceae bacterium]|nr:GDYXXLXY domain-containing protein [Pirellulaceae bacterium]